MSIDVEENKRNDSQDSFFSEFKERISVDPLGDSVKHVKKKASKKQTITIASLIIFAIIAGISWNIYSSYKGNKASIAEIPILRADIEPEKVRPSEPGGMEVPYMDKLVYERIGNSSDINEGYERILPTEEKPVAPEVIEPESLAVSEDKIGSMIEDLEGKVTGEGQEGVNKGDVSNLAKENVSGEVTTKGVEVLEQKEKEEAGTSISKEKVGEGVKQVSGKKEVEKEKVAVKEEQGSKVSLEGGKQVLASEGDFRVQILSGKDKEAVEKAGKALLSKYPSILRGYSYEVIEAEVTGRGKFYRLRIKSFASRESAQEVCKALKEQGQDCLVSSK